MSKTPLRFSSAIPSNWPAQVRLIIGIPSITTFFVLCLGLATTVISRKFLILTDGITPADAVQASISHITTAILISAFGAFVAGYALALSLTRPLKMLAEKAQRIAQGDLAGGSRVRESLGAIPEFAALNRALNQAASSLSSVIISGVNCGIITIDGKGIITSINTNAAELLDCDLKDIVSKPLEKSPLGDTRYSGIEFMVRKTLQTSIPASPIQFDIPALSGKTVTIRVSTSLFRNEKNGSVGLSLRFDDVTEICRIREDMRKIERFVSTAGFTEGIAHQVRNPLCSIRGYAQLLKEKGAYSQDDLPDKIILNVDLIDGIVKSFLDASLRDLPEDITKATATEELKANILSQRTIGAQ